MSGPAKEPARLLIVGASSAAGLGVRGRSFAVRFAETLGGHVEVLQLARTTQTVADLGPEALARIREFRPDLVVCCCGAAEAFVHPSRLLQRLLDRFAPRSWRGVAGLEPRARYSRSRLKRLRQLLTTRCKGLLKRAIIAVTGGYHRLPAEVFEARLRELLDVWAGCPTVLIGLWRVDDRLFPRSNAVLDRHDRILRAIAADRDDVRYVATTDAVRRWDDFLADHAHLNDDGHDRIAALIAEALRDPATAATR